MDENEIDKIVNDRMELKELEKSLKRIKSYQKAGLAIGILFLCVAVVLLGIAFGVHSQKRILTDAIEGKVVFDEDLNITLLKQDFAISIVVVMAIIVGTSGWLVISFYPETKDIKKLEKILETGKDQ